MKIRKKMRTNKVRRKRTRKKTGEIKKSGEQIQEKNEN